MRKAESGKLKCEYIKARVTVEEKKELLKQAEDHGMNISDYIRYCLSVVEELEA